MKNVEQLTGFKLCFRPKVQFAPETAQIGFPPCPLRRPPAVRGNASKGRRVAVRGSHARAAPPPCCRASLCPARRSGAPEHSPSFSPTRPHSLLAPSRALLAPVQLSAMAGDTQARCRRVSLPTASLHPNGPQDHLPLTTPRLWTSFTDAFGR